MSPSQGHKVPGRSSKSKGRARTAPFKASRGPRTSRLEEVQHSAHRRPEARRRAGRVGAVACHVVYVMLLRHFETFKENPSKNSEGNIMLSLNFKAEDEDIMQSSSGENVHPGLHSTDLSSNLPNHQGPSSDQSRTATSTAQKGGKRFRCDEAFTKSSRLYTGDKPHTCSECGKCFTKKSNLVLHERVHTGVKPYSCSECGKCFARKSHLVRHERIHTGQKPYSCAKCGKCFTEKSSLVCHERSHTGEKPYSCSECGKCFKRRGQLVIHLRIHKG